MSKTVPRFPDVFHAWRHMVTYNQFLEATEEAGIAYTLVNAMIVGNPVKRADAEKILSVFSLLTQITWTLETVSVELIEEGEQHAK